MTKLVNFFFLFGVVFESQFGPHFDPKIGSKFVSFWVNFGFLFLGFRSSLGASLEPSWASQGSLGRPLDPKNL